MVDEMPTSSRLSVTIAGMKDGHSRCVIEWLYVRLCILAAVRFLLFCIRSALIEKTERDRKVIGRTPTCQGIRFHSILSYTLQFKFRNSAPSMVL